MSQLPNIISGLRLLFIPIFILTFLDGSYLLALIIFILMSISDAFDGILITGDLVNNHNSLVKESRFRFGFDNKDHYQDLMQKIPTSLINVSEIGLLGIYRFFEAETIK